MVGIQKVKWRLQYVCGVFCMGCIDCIPLLRCSPVVLHRILLLRWQLASASPSTIVFRRMICNANVLTQHLRGLMWLVLVVQVVFVCPLEAKVMPKCVFMEGVVLFALHHVVVAHIDGGEELSINVTCVV